MSSLTVWSFTVTFLNKHKCNHTHPITMAFLLITEILLWLSLKRKAKRKEKEKSQNVNSCIKPVHFCIYRVRDHLCTCYILSHSGKISSPSTGTDVGSLLPFLSPIWGGKDAEMSQGQCLRYRRLQTTLTGRLKDTVHVDMSADQCGKQLCAWTPGAWRTDFGLVVSGSL